MYSTQKELVLNHLKTYGHISSWEAIERYHITRLSEYIRSLRHDDLINIDDKWKENETRRWKEYYLPRDIVLTVVKVGKQEQLVF